jgi:hypothetical protein
VKTAEPEDAARPMSVREASLQELQGALGSLMGRKIHEQIHAEEPASQGDAPPEAAS